MWHPRPAAGWCRALTPAPLYFSVGLARAVGSVLVLFLAGTAPLTAATNTNSAPTASIPAAIELEYERLLELDNAALEEVDRWIREEEAQWEQGAAVSDVTLRARIQERFRPVRIAYDEFLRKHPNHARAYLAYASFLLEIGDEDTGVQHMEKSRELDPSNPAAWNNLANHFGHRGPVKKAFEYYAKAIELDPKEPVYYQNLATTVFLFRRDAEEYYKLDEPAVFEKSLGLYREAMRLDPTNFLLASDYANSFYGMRPLGSADPVYREQETHKLAERAIAGWDAVLRLAADDLQREGTMIHLARNKFLAGRYGAARADLAAVTNAVYLDIKDKILRNIAAKEAGENATTNRPPGSPNSTP